MLKFGEILGIEDGSRLEADVASWIDERNYAFLKKFLLLLPLPLPLPPPPPPPLLSYKLLPVL